MRARALFARRMIFSPGGGLPLAQWRWPGLRLLRPSTFLLLFHVLFAPGAHAQAAGDSVTINVGTLILAEPGVETPLPIQVGPTNRIPTNSFLRIRGLPSTAALTEGHAIAPGAWAVPLSGLPSLRVRLPSAATGKTPITITLVDVDGNVLGEARAHVLVGTAVTLAPPPVVSPPPAPAQAASPPPGTDALPADLQQVTVQFNAALRMLTKGDEMIVAGNVALARSYYQRAAEMGLARGALALAGTFDATELSRRKVVGVLPDPDQARQWYERARELGAPEAAERLSRLGTR